MRIGAGTVTVTVGVDIVAGVGGGVGVDPGVVEAGEVGESVELVDAVPATAATLGVAAGRVRAKAAKPPMTRIPAAAPMSSPPRRLWLMEGGLAGPVG